MDNTAQLNLFPDGGDDDVPKKAEHKAGQLEGERRRDEAHAAHERHRRVFLLAARREAINVALANGEVDADDIRERIELPADKSPTVFGGVCRGLASHGILRFDRFKRSRRPEAHARDIRVWSLADRHKAGTELQVIAATLAVLERREGCADA